MAENKKFTFSFKKFAATAALRYDKKEADTFIIIYGKPRTGKTSLGFNILIPYIHLIKKGKIQCEGKGVQIPRGWKGIFKEFFSDSAGDMIKKIKHNPKRTPVFIDEGNDVASWTHQLEREQVDLMELLQKSGERGNIILLIVPNMKLLTKNMLSRAHYLFMIIHEPKDDNNSFYLFKNHDNPILAENMPFGFPKIEKDILKYPFLSKEKHFDEYVRKSDRFIGKFHFRPVNKKIYALYKKIIKDPSIQKERKRVSVVGKDKFDKLQYAFDVLVHNLNARDNKTVAQIHTLLTDKFGFSLITKPTLSSHIDKMKMTSVRPEIGNSEIIDEEINESEVEDIELDDELEKDDDNQVAQE